MKQINIFVCDSYHTHEIAKSLQAYFGDRVVCHEEDIPHGVTIDIFVLSGRDVLFGGLEYISRLKKKGSSKSKIMAVSVLDDYLERIERRPELGVDFTFPKRKLVDGLFLADSGRLNNAKSILDRLLASVS